MEIERKYILPPPEFCLEGYTALEIEQSYISTDPVIRLRKANDEYILTVKGPGNITRQEFELAISAEAYNALLHKTEGRIIKKTRYLIPISDGLTAEADVYHGYLDGLMTVEVEFKSEEEMLAFTPPSWFGRDVSEDRAYKNTALAFS